MLTYAQIMIDRPLSTEDTDPIRQDAVGIGPLGRVVNIVAPEPWRVRRVLENLTMRSYRVERSEFIQVYKLGYRFRSCDAELFTGIMDSALKWRYNDEEQVELCSKCFATREPQGQFEIVVNEQMNAPMFTCGPHFVVNARGKAVMQRFSNESVEFGAVVDWNGKRDHYWRLIFKHTEYAVADEWTFQDGHPCSACGRPQRGFVRTAIRRPDFAYSGEPAAFAHSTRYGSGHQAIVPVFRSDLMAALVKIGGWDAYPLVDINSPHGRLVVGALTEIRKVAV